ncbi:Uncharacterised protein [Chlamydia trachomatis]|nr:Uncharacterised protein [Chlamydia trachomatis]
MFVAITLDGAVQTYCYAVIKGGEVALDAEEQLALKVVKDGMGYVAGGKVHHPEIALSDKDASVVLCGEACMEALSVGGSFFGEPV